MSFSGQQNVFLRTEKKKKKENKILFKDKLNNFIFQDTEVFFSQHDNRKYHRVIKINYSRKCNKTNHGPVKKFLKLLYINLKNFNAHKIYEELGKKKLYL